MRWSSSGDCLSLLLDSCCWMLLKHLFQHSPWEDQRILIETLSYQNYRFFFISRNQNYLKEVYTWCYHKTHLMRDLGCLTMEVYLHGLTEQGCLAMLLCTKNQRSMVKTEQSWRHLRTNRSPWFTGWTDSHGGVFVMRLCHVLKSAVVSCIERNLYGIWKMFVPCSERWLTEDG